MKNEKYYGHDERYPDNQLPYIDKITLVYIADSANVLAQAMAKSLTGSVKTERACCPATSWLSCPLPTG